MSADRTPAEEMRAAAAKLRGAREFLGEDISCSSHEFLALIGSLIAAINPLATWLENAARETEEIGVDPAALAVARQINGTGA